MAQVFHPSSIGRGESVTKKKRQLHSYTFVAIAFDLIRLSYTEAVLMEVQRISDIVPLGVAHRATKATRLQGYTIPEVCGPSYVT